MQVVNRVTACVTALSLTLSLSACSISLNLGGNTKDDTVISAETVTT